MHERIDIETLLAQWNLQEVEVRNGEVWACCPLHNESTPSFSVNVETGAWHCFGCKSGGEDLVDLAMRLQGLSTGEAEEILEQFGYDARGQLLRSLRDKLTAMLERYEEQFEVVDTTETDEWKRYARRIPRYMERRGFSRVTLETHNIGHDVSQNAVVIPVFEQGVCRFIYRRWINARKNSYLYPKGVQKSRYFWGLMEPDEEWDGQRVFINEGYMDSAWVRQELGELALAILGSSMSRVQALKLAELAPGEVILFFDNDEPGVIATILTAELLLREGFRNITYIRFPRGIGDAQEATRQQLERMVARRVSVRTLLRDWEVHREDGANTLRPRRGSSRYKALIGA